MILPQVGMHKHRIEGKMPFLGQKAGGANHNRKQFTRMEKIDTGIHTGHPAARVRDADCRSSVAVVSLVSLVSDVAVVSLVSDVAVLQIHHLPLASANCSKCSRCSECSGCSSAESIDRAWVQSYIVKFFTRPEYPGKFQ